ncbi:MAG: hypothetical protein WB767_12585 [Nocardioides sp.]
MTHTSTVYTIGTALGRAHDNDIDVSVLLHSQWIHGHVLAIDGHGVILSSNTSEHYVLRIDHISAVRLTSAPLAATVSPSQASSN